MVRTTSVDALNFMTKSGLSKTFRSRVYKYIYENGPCTAKQMTDALTGPDQNRSSYDARISELVKMKAIKDVGIAVCPKSNQKLILWDVTDTIPKGNTLADLGFNSLEEYYLSEHWINFRKGYYERHPNACCWITGIKENLDLHHIRYDNLGCEEDDDIVVLCRHMHEKVHKIVKEYKVALDKAHLVIADIVGRKEVMTKDEIQEMFGHLDHYKERKVIYQTLMSFIVKELGALRPLLDWLRKMEPK